MKDKVKLTYKDRKLKIMLGKKELPLSKLIDPCQIILSGSELPVLAFELVIDEMSIDDMEAFGKFITKEELAETKLPEPNLPREFKKG